MKIGAFLLGVWLILTGLSSLINLHFQYDHLVMGLLAVAAGVFTMVRG